MRIKVKNKINQKIPRSIYSIRKKRDGFHYGIYEIPLRISDYAFEAVLLSIKEEHYDLKKRLEDGQAMRRRHGELTGRADRYKKRDKFIIKIHKKAIIDGMPKKAIVTLLKNELEKKKWTELSEERLRKIIKS